MKKMFILLLIMSNISFTGGEISFEKQNQKLRRLEDAQLESIRSNGKNSIQETVEHEDDLELNFEGEQFIKSKLQKSKKNIYKKY